MSPVVENQKPDVEGEELIVKHKVDVDRVLVEEIGQFGRYQLKALAISLVFIVMVAWVFNEFVFTAARVRTRCFIPECDDDTDTDAVTFAPKWLSHALPAAPDGADFDNCHRFASRNITNADTRSKHSCAAEDFNRNITIACESYVYENKNLVVHDFELACKEWQRSLVGSSRTLGMLVGQPLTGYVSDRWGRRAALAFTLISIGCSGIIRAQTTSYLTYVLAGLCETILGGGIYTCIYILMMEIVGPKYRLLTSCFICTFVVVGQSTLVLLAWAIPNWKHLTLAIYIPQLLSISLIWIMTDSTRWYLENGKFEKAEKILKDIAQTNGKQLSIETLLALRESTKAEKLAKMSEVKVEKEVWLVVEVFRHKAILLRCIVAPLWWITMTLVYYGLTINSVNLPTGSKFTNFLVVVLCELPGYWTAYFLVDCIGRRTVLAAAFCICGVSQLAYIVMPNDVSAVSLAMFMLGKSSISTALTTLYLYTSELFPTRSRHRLVAYCSMMGRVGAIVAPLTPAFGGNIPFVLFGGMGLTAGLLTLTMPETMGCKLPDTMEQAANIGRRPSLKNFKN